MNVRPQRAHDTIKARPPLCRARLGPYPTPIAIYVKTYLPAMDAVSLASSILTFIDISYKVLRGAYEVHTSATGSLKEFAQIRTVIDDLEQATLELKAPTGQVDPVLAQLALNCNALSGELLGRLRKLESKSHGSWNSFVTAIASMRKQKEILALENRLSEYRQEILLRLAMHTFKEHSALRKKLEDIYHSSQKLANKHAEQLQFVRGDILNELSRSLERLNIDPTDRQSPRLRQKPSQDTLAPAVEDASTLTNPEADLSCDLRTLTEKMQRLESLMHSIPNENHVLRKLYFNSLSQPEVMHRDTVSDTYQWILQGLEDDSSSRAVQRKESTEIPRRSMSPMLESQLAIPTESLVEKHKSLMELKKERLAVITRSVPDAPQTAYLDSMFGDENVSRSVDQLSERTGDLSVNGDDDGVAQDEGQEATECGARHQAAEELNSFLTQSHGTLFIHGKPGCGKSTLMKFLGRNPIVEQALGGWASGRRVIIVRAYVWRSDDVLLRSLPGFHRSILYQILSQCPDLTAQVFGNLGPAELPEAEEIQIPQLAAAFERLVSLCSADESRAFCLFIDGLDELTNHLGRGDNVLYRELAQELVRWAQAPNIKILCSARPYNVFLDIFRPAGPMIEFHTLTRSDIVEFARWKFATSLQEENLSEARDTCLDLVETIADRAEGVFLWASIAVRSLLNIAFEDADEECLRETLRLCSSDLETLVDQMLERVDRSAVIRARSNTLLYIAVHNPYNQPLNSLVYSWLHDMKWFTDPLCQFPFDREHKPYTESEVAARFERTKRLLHQLTQGLLEPREVPDASPYFRYRVDFFHRSVRDHLRESWNSGARANPFATHAAEIEAYSRLRSAETTFVSVPSGPVEHKSTVEILRSLFENTFWWFNDCAHTHPVPFVCLQQFEYASLGPRRKPHATQLAMISAVPATPWTDVAFLGLMLVGGEHSWRWHTTIGRGCSFLHWAAYWRQGHYVIERMERDPGLELRGDPRLDLLLSASLGSDVRLTRCLLDKGRRPEDRAVISMWSGDVKTMTTTTSVWLVLLRDFANNVNNYCWKRKSGAAWPHHLTLAWLERLAQIIEAYLGHGARRGVVFHMTNRKGERCAAGLPELLETFKPSNQLSLERRLQEGPAADPLASERFANYRKVSANDLLREDWVMQGVEVDGESLMRDFLVDVF